MNRMTNGIVAVAVFGGVLLAEGAEAAKPLSGKAAFETLKAMDGEWRGTVTKRDGNPVTVVYRTTSGGSVVIERLFPDTSHEMTSVYHLDGEDLVMTHYCAMQNQPRMRLSRTAGSPSELRFEFDGGTNVDPKKDDHMHSGRFTLVDADHVEAEWAVYQGGRQTGSNRFFLARQKQAAP